MSVRSRSVKKLLIQVSKPVDPRVAIVQHPPAVGGEKSRAVDHVGAVLEKRPEETRVVARVVLEVGVLEERQVARRGGDAGADGGALAHVARVLEVAQPRFFGRQLAQDLARAVGGAVVDHHHFDLGDAGVLDRQDPGQQVAHQIALVVDRHDHAELHRRRARSRCLGRSGRRRRVAGVRCHGHRRSVAHHLALDDDAVTCVVYSNGSPSKSTTSPSLPSLERTDAIVDAEDLRRVDA